MREINFKPSEEEQEKLYHSMHRTASECILYPHDSYEIPVGDYGTPVTLDWRRYGIKAVDLVEDDIKKKCIAFGAFLADLHYVKKSLEFSNYDKYIDDTEIVYVDDYTLVAKILIVLGYGYFMEDYVYETSKDSKWLDERNLRRRIFPSRLPGYIAECLSFGRGIRGFYMLRNLNVLSRNYLDMAAYCYGGDSMFWGWRELLSRIWFIPKEEMDTLIDLHKKSK